MILETAMLATVISGMAMSDPATSPGDPAGWDRLKIGTKCIYTDDKQKQTRCFFTANVTGAFLITRATRMEEIDKTAAEFCVTAGYPAGWSARALDYIVTAQAVSIRSLYCEGSE
jgi:hypothetical protein